MTLLHHLRYISEFIQVLPIVKIAIVLLTFFFFFFSQVLNDAKAKKYVDGVSVHWYDKGADIEKLTQTHDKFPDQYILSTEACEGQFF